MSQQISMATAQTQNQDAKVHRRLANFRPSLWGDHFLSYSNKSEETIDDLEKVQGLKEEVQRMLMAPIDNLLEKLELIDAIQRLGVSYHFEGEIDEVLQQIHKYHYTCDVQESDDALYTVALHFRLLRQQGYNILSVDIFNKFKDNMGNFKESLTNDVNGMLSFYEATHMRVHGEDILDEALKFTTTHLESMAINFSPPLATQVSHALNRPIRKCLPRVEARRYFSIYQENASPNEVLLNFAKLDFNMLQKQHQKELSHISRWWKGIDVATNLSFARDRMVELYFWALGVYFEPQYSLDRKMLTKIMCMISTIDDIYDAYGTHKELELFTDAIKRWDISCIDQLPKYMKLCYKVLLDVFEEIEEEMCKDGRLSTVFMKKLVQAYFEEVVWLKEKYIPTVEEYMSNALISCGYLTLSTISFIVMGDIATKEALEWVIKEPKIVRAASIICRLMDDVVSNEYFYFNSVYERLVQYYKELDPHLQIYDMFEQERGHVVLGIEGYMKQYGVSKQGAHDEFRKQIMNAWKDKNKECNTP
ncbi:(-)-germacrene D synthase-like [Quercus lobata]|uniref:(-)-germacrene D synthase-like n=1 Tax=Quercus lobata TaxID=97700 RepID=UPI0012476C62|nr:(-)-germacrene D synthase-like [Quercus lobata]